jgi:hypothetical protein
MPKNETHITIISTGAAGKRRGPGVVPAEFQTQLMVEAPCLAEEQQGANGASEFVIFSVGGRQVIAHIVRKRQPRDT